jgi:excisionase family DNA binding protein
MGKMYSIEAVAAELHATVRTIQGYCKTKRLRGVKVGNSWIIPAEAVRRFLAGEDEK